ncbi:hypothetical protein AGMMS50229_00130 [Campylobacterota bacterium]|nr:hypothetical protein AGMMS50229_00130 [Campylobacterota bacterium]
MYKLGITTYEELRDRKKWLTPLLKRPVITSIALYEEAAQDDLANGDAPLDLSLSLGTSTKRLQRFAGRI